MMVARGGASSLSWMILGAVMFLFMWLLEGRENAQTYQAASTDTDGDKATAGPNRSSAGFGKSIAQAAYQPNTAVSSDAA